MQEAEEGTDEGREKHTRFRKLQAVKDRIANAVKANMTLRSGGYDHSESSDFEGIQESVAKNYVEGQYGATDSIVFGGGCFWCSEAVFEMLRGVIKTTPGYAGGATKNPTYEQVRSGTTGHAEVIKVDYDPKVISLDKILEIFFKAHDPTSVNRQGADVGSQYRSIILYSDAAERKVIETYIKKIAGNYDKPIATEVKRLDAFYESEEYHRDYYKKHPLEPYCMLVTRPEVNKIKTEFADYLK